MNIHMINTPKYLANKTQDYLTKKSSDFNNYSDIIIYTNQQNAHRKAAYSGSTVKHITSLQKYYASFFCAIIAKKDINQYLFLDNGSSYFYIDNPHTQGNNQEGQIIRLLNYFEIRNDICDMYTTEYLIETLENNHKRKKYYHKGYQRLQKKLYKLFPNEVMASQL